MAAVDERLVRRDHGLIQLLDPPFDAGNVDPGYIRGYVPGVRENGGQYTHGAIWAAMAFAALGEGALAWELTRMMNPVNRTATPQDVATYKIEPYVMAADVYAVSPHAGRGGWSWYTGSAGWMYRLVLESLLGLTREGERLRFAPCLPADWDGFSIRYRHGDTFHDIRVEHAPGIDGTRGQVSVSMDGVVLPDATAPLADDGLAHEIVVRVPSPSPGRLPP
jgi:cellobiose phosphorylase